MGACGLARVAIGYEGEVTRCGYGVKQDACHDAHCAQETARKSRCVLAQMARSLDLALDLQRVVGPSR